MRLRGRETDALALEEIELTPGVTVGELAEEFGWSNGKADGSVSRLAAEGRVQVKHILRRGNLVKKVYPQHYAAPHPGHIEIPLSMIDRDAWEDTAKVYLLSRSTIGISPERVQEWESKALGKELVPISRTRRSIELELPPSVVDFYQLENSEVTLSTSRNVALIIVESASIPVDLSGKSH